MRGADGGSALIAGSGGGAPFLNHRLTQSSIRSPSTSDQPIVHAAAVLAWLYR